MLYISNELSAVNILEKELICQRFLYSQQIVTMPKGRFSKLKGAIANVIVNYCRSIKQLICIDGSNLLQLKKLLSFSGHVYLESVWRSKLLNTLRYLK